MDDQIYNLLIVLMSSVAAVAARRHNGSGVLHDERCRHYLRLCVR